MQSQAEFMAESFHSDTRLAWDLTGLLRVTASFVVDSVKTVVSFERREADSPSYVAFEVDRGDSTAIAHSAFEIFNGVLQAIKTMIS